MVNTPILDAIKANGQTLITIITVITAIAFYAFRIDGLEKAVAAQEIKITKADEYQQEVLIRLSVIETKQDRSSTDITEILQEIKRLK